MLQYSMQVTGNVDHEIGPEKLKDVSIPISWSFFRTLNSVSNYEYNQFLTYPVLTYGI